METKYTLETETGLNEKSENNKKQQSIVRNFVLETFEKKIDPNWKPPPFISKASRNPIGQESSFNTYLRTENKISQYTTSRLKPLNPHTETQAKRMPSRKRSR